MAHSGSQVRNDKFDPGVGFQLGRPKTVFLLWYLCKCVFFLSAFPWPSGIKSMVLRAFGAEVGRSVYWKPRVNIHIPWRLKVGEFTWVGEEACFYNFALVTVGAHCCLSQRAFICAGNHDYTREDMAYRHAPIEIQDGVWIGAQTFVGPGVTLACDCVVTAGSVVTRSLPGGMVCAGNPCQPVRPRWKEPEAASGEGTASRANANQSGCRPSCGS
jgi:putative colanic acid biosynthesis acetyltransferase WcaF